MALPPLRPLLSVWGVRPGVIPFLALPAVLLGSVVDRPSPPGTSPVAFVAKCDPLPTPRSLTSANAVLDSTLLAAGLASISTDAGEALTISIRFGAQPTGHIVDVAEPTATQAALLDLVMSTVRSGSGAVATRVVVLPGPTPALRLERSMLCAPESRGGRSGSSQPAVVGRVTSSAPGAAAPQSRPVRTRIRISETGNVLAVEIVQGSGYPEIDRAVRETSLATRYSPALLDGRPVEVWLTENRVELVR